MAHGTVTLVNPTSEQVKTVPVGYSWTTLFFGCFPALFRQDWPGFAILLVTLLLTGFIGVAIIPLIVFSFIYNDKMFLTNLLDAGWKIEKYTGTKSLDAVAQTTGYNLKRYMLEQ